MTITPRKDKWRLRWGCAVVSSTEGGLFRLGPGIALEPGSRIGPTALGRSRFARSRRQIRTDFDRAAQGVGTRSIKTTVRTVADGTH